MSARRVFRWGMVWLLGSLVLSGCGGSEGEGQERSSELEPHRDSTEVVRNEQAIDAFDRGNANLQRGEFDRAIADYSEAIRLDPNLAVAYSNRGLVYARDKREYDLAIADFSEAIRLNPKLTKGYYGRGLAYQFKGEWARAEADFAKANVVPGTGTGELARLTHAGFYVPDPERIPSQLATNPGSPWGDYVGSEACRRCHEPEYAKWRRSFHSRTLYDAAAPTVFGDFSGKTRFDDLRYPWFIVEPYTREDPETGRERYYMKIRHRTKAEGLSDRARSADTYGAGVPDLSHGDVEVIFAFGNRRHQPYVARWPDGKHWVLPILWNDVKRSWEYDGFRPYVESCATCHTTGIRTSPRPHAAGQKPFADTSPPRWNLPPEREGWAEGAVGCEVCHGPGRLHVRDVERLGVDRYRAMLASGEKGPTIYDGARATFTQRLDQCGLCHNFFTENSITWVPGPEGFDRDALRSPLPFSKIEYYEDGSHKSPCTIVTVYSTSKMYAKGIGCWHCHDAHGSDHWPSLKEPITNNELCISCHEDLAATEAQAGHSRHAPDSAGNRCVECHMPRHMVFTDGVHMMSDRIHSHEFSVPTGERRRGGPPSSCNICHKDRDHAWTRAVLDAWKNGTEPPR